MANSSTSAKLDLQAPGPGPWKQDPVHFPRALTRYFQETHPAPFKQGTNDFARFYGLLIDGLQMTYVEGFGYNQVLPAPEAEIPQRFARAAEVFAGKLWREQLREWDSQAKPRAIATHRELQGIEPLNLRLSARSDVAFIHFNRLRLQVTFGRFQAAPTRVTEQPERFARQVAAGSAHRGLTQRRVKNFLCLP